MPSIITGTGHHVPSRCVTNDEIAALVGSSSAWIEERSGICQRYFVGDGESNASIAAVAARRALEDAGLEASDLDAIVYATLSPDMAFPGSGVFMQRELGLNNIPALDVRAQCSGFIYALSVAHAWLVAGMYERVLVVGSEVHSTGLDLSQAGRAVAVLFGDGAGAVILERSEGKGAGIIDIRLGADGSGAHLLRCERPGSRYSPSIDYSALDDGLHFPQMEGRSVFRRAVEMLERELAALFARNQLALDDILLVPHQSNQRINELVGARLGLRPDQIVHTIASFGNTTAASIPMALDIARRDGRAQPGRLIALAAFGSGLTWGTALLEV
ncbi:MAG: ketoacyl-ACP synthase III [Bradymonadaceae bacterium]|nr:ketoacyl-ACP synthase III [Lujinxingiaceae bacterium]